MAIRKINGATLTDIAGIFCLHYSKLLIFCRLYRFSADIRDDAPVAGRI